MSDETMPGASKPIEFVVITPTYHRESLLRRFVKQVVAQTYPHWKLLVIHDGPNEETDRLIAGYQAHDPRIQLIHTVERGDDFGVTPRRDGLRWAVANGDADYAVLWDDDDYFTKAALETIANGLEATGRPAMLLAPNRYRNRSIPPRDVAVADLTTGQVTTGNMTVRPDLALEVYERIVAMKQGGDARSMYVQDYLLFDQVRNATPPQRIEILRAPVIGMHDGLRRQVYLRNMLGIPPLGLLNRQRINRLMFWRSARSD